MEADLARVGRKPRRVVLVVPGGRVHADPEIVCNPLGPGAVADPLPGTMQCRNHLTNHDGLHNTSRQRRYANSARNMRDERPFSFWTSLGNATTGGTSTSR